MKNKLFVIVCILLLSTIVGLLIYAAYKYRHLDNFLGEFDMTYLLPANYYDTDSGYAQLFQVLHKTPYYEDRAEIVNFIKNNFPNNGKDSSNYDSDTEFGETIRYRYTTSGDCNKYLLVHIEYHNQYSLSSIPRDDAENLFKIIHLEILDTLPNSLLYHILPANYYDSDNKYAKFFNALLKTQYYKDRAEIVYMLNRNGLLWIPDEVIVDGKYLIVNQSKDYWEWLTVIDLESKSELSDLFILPDDNNDKNFNSIVNRYLPNDEQLQTDEEFKKSDMGVYPRFGISFSGWKKKHSMTLTIVVSTVDAYYATIPCADAAPFLTQKGYEIFCR